jgi:hypothetical protein
MTGAVDHRSRHDRAVDDLDITRPFPRWRGLRAGISRHALDGAEFRRVLHGIAVAASVPDTPRLRAEAALVCFFDSAHASHATAARVWEVPVRLPPGDDVTVPEVGHRLRRRGVRCHVRPGVPTTMVDGVRVSTLPQLFVELAEMLPLVELVVVGDWMLRRRGVTAEELAAAARRTEAEAGQLARRAARYVRPRVDSPMETRSRMLLVLAALPEPRVNAVVRDEDGCVVRRHDMDWPKVRLALEFDGRHHVEREDQWEKDLLRREAAEGDGWRVIVLVARDIYRRPEQTVERVFAALRDRGATGLPKRPSQEWRRHFETWSDVA